MHVTVQLIRHLVLLRSYKKQDLVRVLDTFSYKFFHDLIKILLRSY